MPLPSGPDLGIYIREIPLAHVITVACIYVTLSHLRSKESTEIHKPCIPALLSYQGCI